MTEEFRGKVTEEFRGKVTEEFCGKKVQCFSQAVFESLNDMEVYSKANIILVTIARSS